MEDFKYILNGVEYQMLSYKGLTSVEIFVSDIRGKYPDESVILPIGVFKKMAEHFNAIP
jgi:hypothetical protein